MYFFLIKDLRKLVLKAIKLIEGYVIILRNLIMMIVDIKIIPEKHENSIM